MVKAIIEIPKGSFFKYEDKAGQLFVDRVLNQPCPENYGYLDNGVVAADGDAEDVFVIGEPLLALSKMNLTLTHKIHCLDRGVQDDKYVGFIVGDPAYTSFLKNPFGEVNAIINYLKTYKEGFEVIKLEKLE